METVINIHVVAGWEVQPAYIPFQRLEKYWSHRIISPGKRENQWYLKPPRN